MSFTGIGIYQPKSEVNIGTLMRSAWNFGVNFVFTIGKRYKRRASDTPNVSAQIPCYHYLTFEDFLQYGVPFSCPIVGVELDPRSKKLTQFSHPKNSIYLLGAEDHGIPQSILDRCHQVVEIPDLKQCLNVSAAGSIVLYDRLLKEKIK